jgi:hypothetical protein
MKTAGHPIAARALLMASFFASSALSTGSARAASPPNCGLKPCSNPVPQGSCQPSSSLTVLVKGTNVTAYVPKGSWSGGAVGVGVLNVEGSSITNTLVPTPNVVNSCASNAVTGKTVCTANNNEVYLLTGTTIGLPPLKSAGTGTISFSGGSCTNCGVAMDAVHNKALIGLSIGGVGGFQFLNLATSVFETAFKSQGPGGRFRKTR